MLEGRWSSFWMAWRLVCESVKMPIHGSFLYMLSATWMATSSALVIVWVSSWPDASMYVVVLVGECITTAPIRGCPFWGEPSV